MYKDAISTSTTQITTCKQYGTITETREASDRNRDESEETAERDDTKIRYSERGSKKRKSESVRRVRELKMSLSRKSKLLEASKTRVTELENELASLKSKHESLQGRVERSKLNLSRRENLMKDTKKRFAEIGNDLRTHKEELAASKSRLRHEIAALKSCRNRNESLREEITRLQEKLKLKSNEKRNNTHPHHRNV